MSNTQLILKMYKNRVSPKKISSILDISILDVHRCLSEASPNYVERKHSERDKSIVDMYRGGEMITKIASILKINRHTVTDVLKDNGEYKGNIRASNDDESKKERNELILKMYEDGLSGNKVAEAVGVCPATVFKVLRHFKAESRPVHQKRPW